MFRCGVEQITLDTGHYEHLNVDERICPICGTGVQSEEHVLTRCDVYLYFRNELYNYANDINADFSNMNECDKMCFILANPDICRTSAKTCYEILCHWKIYQ